MIAASDALFATHFARSPVVASPDFDDVDVSIHHSYGISDPEVRVIMEEGHACLLPMDRRAGESFAIRLKPPPMYKTFELS